ncbi:hypothetical protein FNV43_RR01638 [Rhamnella rubrinervis]|uniref:Receptor-like protein 12 n=1 Tax=Rhamnella rubrinervis TaxID=2594499 RepID=A0A8K0MS78_9ROSA|nr:hypothetical protein FNV43_RR01638 [Rhamnella rubrinervis]
MKCISFQNLHIVFYLTIFISYRGIYVSCSPNVSTTNSAFKCLPDQTTALLQFKQDFSFQKPNFSYYYYHCSMFSNPYYNDIQPDSYPKMKFWKEEKDCCSWDGVTCHMKTGHVVGLDLSHSWLQGPLRSNSSLFKLHQLQKINLAYNNFTFCHIPSEFGQLSRLTDLILYYSMFSGQIPSEISCLTNLVYLGLSSFKNYDDTSFLYLKRVDLTSFIQNMTNLRRLYLRHVNLSSSVPESLTNLSSLTHLSLGGCGLYGKFPEELFQLPKLEFIQVPCNYLLNGFLPQFQNSSSLRQLNLAITNFSGKLPVSIGHLESLSAFVICQCNFVGPLPSSIWNLSNLSIVDLSFNHFNSHELPSTLGNHAKPNLVALWLRSAQFSGEIPSSIGNLTQLKHLDISYNSLSLPKVNTISELPKFQTLYLASCNLSEFPKFLKTQDQLEHLDLSNNRIEGQIPKWFWGIANKKLDFLDLSGNKLQGSLSVPPLFTSFFDISENNLTGKIHPSFRNWTNLKVLDMSENRFSGTIPQWLGNFGTSLEILNLHGNNIHGSLHQMLTKSSMLHLKKLDLSHNQLRGKVPQFLRNCSKLQVLNLGHNQISDTFPFWLQSMPELQVLVLRQNKFYGPIWHPPKFWSFERLHIMDLSFNNFSGSLPSEYFTDWVAMIQRPCGNTEQLRYVEDKLYPFKHYLNSITVINKGLEMKSMRILTAFTSIDLSNNRFDGEIPSSIGNLQALVVLNLSSNNFTGSIPPSLGNMSELESLDLSRNKLTCRIPQQLTDLTFLEYLNLSQNQLTGPIPRGSQFETFSSSSYVQNPELYGPPLSRICDKEDSPIFHQDNEVESEDGFTWKPVVVGYGFGIVVGFIIGHVTLSQRRSNWFWRSSVGKFIHAAC